MNRTIREAENRAENLQQYKKNFIDYNVNECGGDRKVIEFVAEVRFHGSPHGSHEDSIETIRYLFESGYCYYFAKMLEQAFPGGTICYCYNFGHIVYVFDEVAYDISGVSDAEVELLIPIEELGDSVLDFMHIPGKRFCTTVKQIEKLGERVRKEGNDVYALMEHPKCKEIVTRCKDIMSENVSEENRNLKEVIMDAVSDSTKKCRDGELTWQERDTYLTRLFRDNNLNWLLCKRLKQENSDVNKISAF